MHVGERQFTLRSGVITTIGDYHGLGTIFGCAHQGGVGCILCHENVTSRRLNKLGKTVYEESQQWIKRNHPYWRNFACTHFNNKVESKEASKPLSVPQLLEAIKSYKIWLARKATVLGVNTIPQKFMV